VVRECGESKACTYAAALVQDAVVYFCAGAEASLDWLVVGGCCGSEAWVRPEVIEAAQAQKRRVGAVHVLGGVFAEVVLQQREDCAAVVEVRVADCCDAELTRGCQSAQV